MKERLVTNEFSGSDCQVTVTGVPAGVCSYCGRAAIDANAFDEIQMFVEPLLAGEIGMRMLRMPHITIDLGHSLHPSAIDIAGAPQRRLQAPETPVPRVRRVTPRRSRDGNKTSKARAA